MTNFCNTPLEYDAQCAVRSQRFKIQHCCAYSYLERSIHPLERIDITADQRIDLTAAYPIDKKRRVRLDFFFRHFLDPHIGDEATGARPGKFPMSMSRARGHVRRDPQLGTLIRNVEAEAWEGDFRVRDRTVEILIDGKKEPNPALVARARKLVADFDTFERRLNDYLAQTAKEWASETPELAADISALRLSSIKLRSRQPVLVDFDGPDVDVYWSCEYADGKFSGLDFDS